MSQRPVRAFVVHPSFEKGRNPFSFSSQWFSESTAVVFVEALRNPGLNMCSCGSLLCESSVPIEIEM
ncbi:uncharacterized protein LOC123008298 [Tribolium madens]|uniref:uncharacterized protein LOC123008298 n=1 Tax=Tribolium madens TaxID=41895 RepID=UPI001CF71FCA|nr:uncharacterized protein LOC123008298 [Tribolium madens]